MQILQKIITNVGATNEQTNENKVQDKKNKVSVLKQNKQSISLLYDINYHYLNSQLILIIIFI